MDEQMQEVRGFDAVDPTPNQPANVETPAPASTPGAMPPTSPATTPAVPLDVLNQLVRQELGDSYTVNSAEDVAKILGAKHKEMREKQELAAQQGTRLRKYEPFINRMEQDKAYERRVYETSLQYAGQLDAQQPEEMAPAVPSPIVGEVLSLKQWKEKQEQREADAFVSSSIEALAADPKYKGLINDDIKRDIALECAARGVFNPKTVFLDKYGDKIDAHARAQAVEEYRTRIQQTNAAGATLGNAPTVAVPVAQDVTDPRTMSKAEADKWGDNEIERIKNDPKYAAQLAKEWIEQSGGMG